MSNPYDKGKGVRFAAANAKAREFKHNVERYIRNHYRIANITPLQKQQLATKFDVSVATINNYLKDLACFQQEMETQGRVHPINAKLLASAIQELPALKFDQVLSLSLDTRHYKDVIPTGISFLRLDFKLYGRNPNQIQCFFTDCLTGKKHTLNLFINDNKLSGREGEVNLLDAYMNGRFFELDIYISKKTGYPVLKQIHFA